MPVISSCLPRAAARRCCALAPALVLSLAATADAARLIPDRVARRHGLERAWFTQVELDSARHSVEKATLHGDQVIVLTTAGVVQALDAHTGSTMWVARIGNPGYPSLGPAVSEDHVAIVNGGTVYVLERATGRPVLTRRARGAVGAAPAVSDNFVFVPQFSGRVDAFSLLEERPIPWYYTSHGRIFHNAVAGDASVAWSTDRGHMYVADPNAEGVRFRFDTGWPIDAPATMQSPNIYAASTGGYVYALNETNGAMKWRYAAGFPVTKSPIALGDELYVATDEPSLHCISTGDGSMKWIAPGVAQFISASQERVYGLDRLGNLIVLDAEHGVIQSRAESQGENTAILNEQTDRLYLVSRDGLVQCFHEIGAGEPYRHQPKTAKPEAAPPEKEKTTPAPQPTPSEPPQPEAEDPFEGVTDPFAGAQDPFGGGENPFDAGAPDEEEAPAEEDPFGGFPAEDPFGGGENPFE